MHKIFIIDWQENALSVLTDCLAKDFFKNSGRLDNLEIVFPHRRPSRYLQKILAKHPRIAKPLILPRMASIDDWVTSLSSDLSEEGFFLNADTLEQVGLLFNIVQEMGKNGFPKMASISADLGEFFPWGIRLAKLLEELFLNGLKADDLENLGQEVLPTAAAILENLQFIQSEYRKALLERGLTTTGLLHELAAANLLEIEKKLAGKKILLCGVYALRRCEERIFHYLWKQGLAEIVWHTDPALADGFPAEQRSIAHGTEEHLAWKKRWRATCKLIEKNENLSPGKSQKPLFFVGHDLHSQLLAFQNELSSALEQEKAQSGFAEQEKSIAVIIPDTSMLMPVLHHLPQVEVNVSMGYPLTRSNLGILLETIFSLAASRTEDGKYPWKELIHLIRHPYLGMLGSPASDPGSSTVLAASSFRSLLHMLEGEIRQGSVFFDPKGWRPFRETASKTIEGKDFLIGESELNLFDELIDRALIAFENLGCLKDAAQALSDLLEFFLHDKVFGPIWEKFPLDSECLYRLADRIIPALKNSTIASTSLDIQKISSIVKELISEERVPFDAEPLLGLQVLGPLETRFLNFDRLFVIGADDDLLPGTPISDPLLPDSLRGLLNLPTSRSRDLMAAQTFHRLIKGASEVYIFYGGTRASAGIGGNKEPSARSRYVEQLIWEIDEQKEINSTELIKSVPLPLFGIPATRKGVKKTDVILKTLRQRLKKEPLSATFFDDYLFCPLHFFFKYILHLKPTLEVAEEGDQGEFGSMVHEILKEFFSPFVGRQLSRSDLDPNKLKSLYRDGLRKTSFFRQIGPDLALILEKTGEIRLERFLNELPSGSANSLSNELQNPDTPSAGGLFILALEKKLTENINYENNLLRLQGNVDRIDRRKDEILIIDYKTGKTKASDYQGWQNKELFDCLATWEDPEGGAVQDVEDPLFLQLRASIKSVQLPLYLFLLLECEDFQPISAEKINGTYVNLGEDGKESLFFPAKTIPETKREIISTHLPELLNFILTHMLYTDSFIPTPGNQCAHCFARKACAAKASRF